MTTKLGLTLVGGPLEEYQRLTRVADEAGVAGLGIGDSQSLYQEMYVRCTLTALNSQRALLGPWVTNPVTRHPAVTASAVASLHELSGGRVFLGLGTGDSAVYNVGLKPASLAQLEDYTRVVKELLERGTTTYQGNDCRFTWFKGKIPIGMAASGPRALRLAGQMADIVWIAAGLTPEAMARAREHVRQGAEAANRRLEDIDIWWVTVLHLGETHDEAVESAVPDLATFGFVGFRYTLEGKGVPSHLSEAVQRFCQGYQSRYHIIAGENPNSRLLRELGLVEFFSHHIAIVGTSEECARRLKELDRGGASKFWFIVRMADKEPFMRRMSAELMPLLGA